MNPVDPVTFDEAARILGCARSTVQVMIADGRLTASGPYERGRLSRADVEALALEVYDWRQHVDDPDAYWLTSHQAADLLGVSRQRLGQLGDKGFVPYVRHRAWVRLYRREQMLTIANAREARWARVAGGTLSGGLAAGV